MQLNLARLLALSVFLVSSVRGQESDELTAQDGLDEFEPAVSTYDLSEADEPGSEQADADAPAPILAQGVTRRQGTAGVMDEMNLGRTEITGNQELPKVLYIVPWQKSGPAELMGKPVNTLLDEVLAPIDRTEFVRQVDYYDDLYNEDEE
jgi:hypothetical protein